MQTRGAFLIRLLRDALVRSHHLTLAERLRQTGSQGCFQPNFVSAPNRSQYVEWGNCDQMCNPDAIMAYLVSLLSLY
jgi:hypothetical protein